MQDLHVVAVEDGALIAVSDGGERFRVAVDASMQARLRQSGPMPDTSRKVSPRDVQTRIRAGRSAEEVAEETGADVEYVRRFEGPVLAEREFVLSSALAVPVRTALETESLEPATFGSVLDSRLDALSATEITWSAWKDEALGWVISLVFTVERAERDARWEFDPKKHALSPSNAEAIALSQQGDPNSLIPRLRAVEADRSTDSSRFDSGAFLVDADEATGMLPTFGREQQDDQPAFGQTADLLEALRRRRGERESARYDDDETSTPSPDHPSAGGVRLVGVQMDTFFEIDVDEPSDAEPAAAAEQNSTGPQSGSGSTGRVARKGRASMPSWDDIVFGTRSDDDLA
jgi:hypothetical protein